MTLMIIYPLIDINVVKKTRKYEIKLDYKKMGNKIIMNNFVMMANYLIYSFLYLIFGSVQKTFV
jgi:hypothetical protein